MEDLSEDEIIELGNFCEALRLHPQWNALIKTFELQIVDHMMSTEPHESKKREGVYASCLGVRDLISHMKVFVETKQKILDQQQPKPSEDVPVPADLDD